MLPDILLFEYSKNVKSTSLLPLVRKIPFNICQTCGTCLVKKGKCMSVPFSENMKSPSDPLSGRTLMIVLLGQLPAECSKLCWVWFVVAFLLPYFCYYSCDPSFYVLLKEELTISRRAPGSLGSDSMGSDSLGSDSLGSDSLGSNNLAVISLCVLFAILATRFLILLGQGIRIN